MDVLLEWLPAAVAAVVCALMTFCWAALILSWGDHVRAGTRGQWLPGPTSQVVALAAIAIWFLAVAGGWLLTGPSADLGRFLVAIGSVVLGLVATLAVWFASELTQDSDRFHVGSKPSRSDLLFRSGATMTYGAVGGAVAGVVVALVVASWAGAAGGFAALAVAVVGAVGAPVLFVVGFVAVAFAGI